MRNIFGYLNYKEWLNTITIGNIMQISPISLKDLLIKNNYDS